jgi:hypothetical protein
MTTSLSSLAAGFVGACALAVSAYTAYLQRQQVRAQVWPIVGVGAETDAQGFKLEMTNIGVGPARVRSSEVRVDGQPLRHWKEVLDRLMPPNSTASGAGWSNVTGSMLAAGASKTVLHVEGDDAKKAFGQGAYQRMSIAVCYCSVLDECWVKETSFREADLTNDGIRSVGQCPKYDVEFAY